MSILDWVIVYLCGLFIIVLLAGLLSWKAKKSANQYALLANMFLWPITLLCLLIMIVFQLAGGKLKDDKE